MGYPYPHVLLFLFFILKRVTHIKQIIQHMAELVRTHRNFEKPILFIKSYDYLPVAPSKFLKTPFI